MEYEGKSIIEGLREIYSSSDSIENKIKKGYTFATLALDFNKEILMKDRHFRYLIVKDKDNYGFIIRTVIHYYKIK